MGCKLTRVPVYVSGQLKQRVIERARRVNRSLTCEVVVFLVRRFLPNDTVLEYDVVKRSAVRNVPATALHDGALESIMLSLPDPLRVAIRTEAQRNFRTLSAEIVRALTEAY